MASVTGGGKDNDLNTDLNLVPFIDLLSSLVLFLLLTVVWVQIAAIQTAVDNHGKSAVSNTDQGKLLVRVGKEGFQLTWPDFLRGQSLPRSVHSLSELDVKIKALLKSNKDIPAAVSGEDSVEYGAVIQALDSLHSSGLNMVTLSTD